MKRLSDYKDEEAIEVWAELLEPFTKIFADKQVTNEMTSGKPALKIAQTILTAHKEDAKQIMLIIDNTPLNGVNMALRLMSIITDLINTPEAQDFLRSAAQEIEDKKSFGAATENTEVGEN